MKPPYICELNPERSTIGVARKHGGRVVYHIDELIKYSKTVSVSGEQ